jgi:hypothetical protein
VDGKGNIVRSEKNDELLWACKGGNNGNFGVVTALTFKVHDAPAMMQSHKFRSYNVTAEKATAILEQWFTITQLLPNSCFSAFVMNKKTLYILLTNTGKQTESVQRFINILTELSDKTTHSKKLPLKLSLKNYYGRQYPLFFKNASAGLYKDFASIKGCIKDALKIVENTPGMIYQVNTLGGAIINNEFEKDSCFPHRDCVYFSELQTYWEQPSQQKKLTERFQQVQQIFINHGIKAQYRNYPDVNFKDWKQYYYAKNYSRLQAIKMEYDAGNLFRFEQGI